MDSYKYIGRYDEETAVAHLGITMLHAAISFHLLHLKVKGEGSYAAHVALQPFYEALPGMADSLIESYQGYKQKIIHCDDDIETKVLNSVEDALYYLQEIYELVNEVQTLLTASEIINDLDLVKSSINALKYKLTFLK